MTEVGVSQSDTLVYPTSTQFPAAKTSWQQSSSVMLSPPTAPPPGIYNTRKQIINFFITPVVY